MGQAGLAIAPSDSTASLAVERTATKLSIETADAGANLVVSGRLETADVHAVPGQTVLFEAGSTSETVTTNATGGYADILDGESLGEPGDRRSVIATFDGNGTNMANTSASTTAIVPAATGDVTGGDGDVTDGDGSATHLFGAAVAIALLGIAVLLARCRGSTAASGEESAAAGSTAAAATPPSQAQPWFDVANIASDGGDDRGTVSRSYAASYAQLQSKLDFGDDLTLRELLAAAEGRIDAAVFDALATVIDAYERMTFAEAETVPAREVPENARVDVEVDAAVA